MAAITPVADPDSLRTALDDHAGRLTPGSSAARVLSRLAATVPAQLDVDPAQQIRWLEEATDLALRFGMDPLPEPPQTAFSWDGRRVRSLSEPSVLVHEVAHFQLSSPARRVLPDFGLGAGPETGLQADADRARCLCDEAREREEQMASLLGVLWEVELGQPGIFAFHEQNWLEGAGRPSAAAFLEETLDRLAALGVIDDDARPTLAMRITPDG